MELKLKLEIEDKGMISLFGKSGAGKTTLLRIIAGLINPDEGIIRLDEEVWFDSKKKICLAPQKRKVGFVFQDYALFPNMSVQKNLLFSLENKREKSRVERVLEMTGLSELKDRMPSSLSGGQQQRVALARALVRNPKILLLDEPLSSLDIEMRLALQDEILSLHDKLGLYTVLVSHDHAEIFKLSREVFVIEDGRIINAGSPSKVFWGGRISGKFKFLGEAVEIVQDGVINILSIRIGNNLVKVVATDEEIENIKPGDQLMIISQALNPIIKKVDLKNPYAS